VAMLIAAIGAGAVPVGMSRSNSRGSIANRSPEKEISETRACFFTGIRIRSKIEIHNSCTFIGPIACGIF